VDWQCGPVWWRMYCCCLGRHPSRPRRSDLTVMLLPTIGRRGRRWNW
jgi:hypothetical protein